MMKNKIQILKDGFANIIKGLGSSKDARQNIYYQRGQIITQQIANDLYTFNWIAAKAIDTPIDDATRKWRSILIPDSEKKKEVEDVFDKFDIKGKINLALKWARVYGGSAIVIVIENDDPKDELKIERISKDSLVNLIVLDRWNIIPEAGAVERDISKQNYGKPEYYRIVRSSEQLIHQSRVIPFYGIIPSIQEFEIENFWGKSYFTRLWEPVSDAQVTSQSINNLVYESNIDVYKIRDLYAMVAEGNDDLVIRRLEVMNEMKSVINGVVIDAEDDWDNKTKNFANLQDIDDRAMQKVSGATGIPMTKLVGISPAGLNSTGEGDANNYDEMIQAIQENEIAKALDRLDPIVMMSAFQDSEGFDYQFLPLKQMSEKEQADTNLIRAQTDQIYFDRDIINPIDILGNLSENGTYTRIDDNRVNEEQEEYEKEEEIDFTNEEPEEPGISVSEGIEQVGESNDTSD